MGQWLLSKWDGKVKRMTVLYTSPLYRRGEPHVAVTCHLNETKLKGTDDMRLVFTTTLTVDVNANDDELRKAFIELVTHAARTVYGPAAMLAKSRPTLMLTVTDRSGMNMLDVFEPTVADRISRD